MDTRPFFRWLRGVVPPANVADQAAARQAYADYLRAQIVGYAPDNATDLLDALTTEDEMGARQNTASFAELMGIETKLAGALSDDLVERTYWIVRERFNRVASSGAIDEHSKWAPPALIEAADRVPIAPVPAAADPGGTGGNTDPLTAEEATARHEQALVLAGVAPEQEPELPSEDDAHDETTLEQDAGDPDYEDTPPIAQPRSEDM